MKKLNLLLLSFLISLGTAAQLNDVIVETYTLSDVNSVQPEGTVTYRIFARMVEPTDLVVAAFAISECHSLDVSTTTTFFNSTNAGTTSASIVPALFPVFPEMEADSYVTIGAEDSTQPGAADVGAVSSSPQNGFTPSLLTNPGVSLNLDDGAWYTTTNSPGAVPSGVDNRVMLGQFTTSGTLSFHLNIQTFLGGNFMTGRVDYVWSMDCITTGFEQEHPSLTFTGAFCGDPGACNYSEGQDNYDNAVCEYETCAGCMNDAFCNYDPDATIDDGSCSDVCPGCTDATASNYDENATEDDGSCLYGGCTDPYASNYDTDADVDDGSCEYFGCTDPEAYNYNPQSTTDDGSCITECDEQIVAIYMTDTFGDGWNGAEYFVFNSDGAYMTSGSLDNADVGDGVSFGYDFMCLPVGEYDITITGGTFPQEVQALIECLAGEPLDLPAPGDYSFTVTDGVDCVPGCTNPLADNYDPDATFDVECVFFGCVDSDATNYDPMANDDDGSCIYELDGYVFYDANENGLFDTLLDYGLSNQEVTLEPDGLIAITDENGYYSFGEVETGEYTIAVNDIEEFPTSTTGNPVELNLLDPTNQPNVNFGVTNSEPVTGVMATWGAFQGITCNGDSDFNWVTVTNAGNQVINGYVEVIFDDAFQGINFNTCEPDSVVGNSFYFSFGPLNAGASHTCTFGLGGPDVEFIGEELSMSVNAYVMVEGQVVASANDEYVDTVTCAYDPNDKQAMPIGYTDQHFILNDTPIDYTIRFQNTGNAPATLVTLVDTLDIDLNMSSFQLVSHSHNVQTLLDTESRELVFTFDNIMLPDSASDPEGSIGFVTYRIIPNSALAPNTTIENTAHIFFDSNPAIVTNTYLHTIYECGEEANFTATSEICFGEDLLAEATHPHVTSWSWTFDGESVGATADLEHMPEMSGSFELSLTAGNPLCESIQTLDILVHALPDASFEQDGFTLSATTGVAWQWYIDGEPIDGATEMSYEAMSNGYYSVEITDDNGCSNTSDEVWVQITNVQGIDGLQLDLYPNPVDDVATLQLPDNGPWNITLIDMNGRVLIRETLSASSSWTLKRASLASGSYVIQVQRVGSDSNASIPVQLR